MSDEKREHSPYFFLSPKMQRIYEDIAEAAECDDVVILLGENGTGKTALAQQIHDQSRRKGKPFKTIDIPTLQQELMRGDLFGVAPKMVTDIKEGRNGFLSEAQGGTVFCDEIGELPLEHQAMLLRVVQARCFRRIGGKTDEKLDVRFIFATNRNLLLMVELGTFRRDLYHRMKQLCITLPPLRELRSDIVPLALHLCKRAAQEQGWNPPSISTELAAKLSAYAWPGNIRELEHAMNSLVRRGKGTTVLGFDGLRPEVREDIERGCGEVPPLSQSGDTFPPVRSIALSAPPCPRHPRYERVMRTELIEQIQQQHLSTQRATVLLQTHRGGGRTLARQLASASDRPVLWLVDSGYERSLPELFFQGLTRDPSITKALDFDRWLRAKVQQEPSLLLILTEPRGPAELLEALASSVKALLDQYADLNFLVIGNERLLWLRTDKHYSWLRLLPGDSLFDIPDLTESEVEALLRIRGLPSEHAGVLMKHTAGHPWLIYELIHKQIFEDEAVLTEVMFQLSHSGKLERHLQDPAARCVFDRLLNNQPVAPLTDPAIRHNPQRYAESRLYFDGFLIADPNGGTIFRGDAVQLLLE